MRSSSLRDLGFDGEGDGRLRQFHRRDRRSCDAFIGQRIAGERVLQLGHRADIAGVQFGHRLQSSCPAARRCAPAARRRCRADIEQVGVVLHHARDHFEIGDAAGERIGRGLEDERRRRARCRRSCCVGFLAVRASPCTGPRSAGAGRFSTMKFSIRSEPTLCSPEAHSTGKMRISRHPASRPSTMCSTGSVPLSKNSSTGRRCPRPPFRPALRGPSWRRRQIRREFRLPCPCRRHRACRCTPSCGPGR